MPIFVLQVRCDCENVAEWQVPADKPYTLDIQQNASDEVRTDVDLDPENEEEMEGGKGVCNLALKFEGSKKQCTMTKIEVKGITTGGKYSGDGWVSIAAFDCRGCEPIKWHPGGGFVVTADGENGAVFDDAELADDWADYDENNDASVQIMDLESKFEKA